MKSARTDRGRLRKQKVAVMMNVRMPRPKATRVPAQDLDFSHPMRCPEIEADEARRMVPNCPRERDAHCHEGEYQPHPVAPLPPGEGRILPVITAPFLTPLPAGSLMIDPCKWSIFH